MCPSGNDLFDPIWFVCHSRMQLIVLYIGTLRIFDLRYIFISFINSSCHLCWTIILEVFTLGSIVLNLPFLMSPHTLQHITSILSLLACHHNSVTRDPCSPFSCFTCVFWCVETGRFCHFSLLHVDGNYCTLVSLVISFLMALLVFPFMHPHCLSHFDFLLILLCLPLLHLIGGFLVHSH